jgi:RND superfamily putative drug exporter
VTSAAVVMVSVFAIFASLHMVEMKELGLGLAVAVLVDALVVRVIVLPALITLFGKRIWWPSRPPRPDSGSVAAAGTVSEPLFAGGSLVGK